MLSSCGTAVLGQQPAIGFVFYNVAWWGRHCSWWGRQCCLPGRRVGLNELKITEP